MRIETIERALTKISEVMRWRFLMLPISMAAMIALITPSPSLSYTLTASPLSVVPGQTVSVNWTAPAGSNAKDWIGWYRAGTPNSAYDQNRWRYTGGATSGTFTTTAPDTPGNFEFRYLLNGQYSETVRSQTIVVSPAVAQRPAHEPITATLLGQTGEDLIGAHALVANGVPDVRIRLNGVSGTLSYVRVTGLDGIWQVPSNGTNWLVAVLPTADPSVVNVVFDYFKPITSYTLVIRYTDGEEQTVAATSSVSLLTTLSLTATPASLQAGQPVVVSWTSPTPNAKDWIAWFKTGDANTDYDRNRWQYTDGAKSGSFTIAAPTTSGTYEFRYLLNNGYTDSARSNAVTVGSATSAPMLLLSASPASISKGEASKLSWSSTNATSCAASGGWSGNKALSGSEDISPTASALFSLTCSSSAGFASQSVTVNVSLPAANPTGDYYVATTGNDSNPGTLQLPFKTLQRAIPILKPGETLFVRGGEYDTVNGLINRGTIIPSGTSWNKPVTIKAYPGEKPVFRRHVENATCCIAYTGATELQVRDGIHLATPAECKAQATVPYPCWGGGGSNMQGYLPWLATHGYVDGYVLQVYGPLKYVIFDGVDFDARGITGGLSLSCNQLCGSESGKTGQYDGPTHLRFQNLEIRNAIASCIAQPGAASEVQSDLQFINVKIHHCGVPYDTNYYNNNPAQGLARLNPNARFYHPWYMHTGGNMLIDSEIYATAGTGLSPDGDNNIISGNFIHDNASHGMYISGGKNWVVEDNVFYNNGGIEIYHAAEPGHRISNNTIVAGPKIAAGQTAGYSIGIYAHRGAYGSIYENNIIDGFQTGISNNGTYVNYGYSPNTTVRNNLIRTSVAGNEVTTSKGTCPECPVAPIMSKNIFNLDPLFVNKAVADFRLKPASPAIGKATDGGNIGAAIEDD